MQLQIHQETIVIRDFHCFLPRVTMMILLFCLRRVLHRPLIGNFANSLLPVGVGVVIAVPAETGVAVGIIAATGVMVMMVLRLLIVIVATGIAVITVHRPPCLRLWCPRPLPGGRNEDELT
jgi:hypothetical protein